MTKCEPVSVEILLNRSKKLDEAVFMAIEALDKCRCNEGVIAEERLRRAISGLQEVYTEITRITDKHQFPSKGYLESKDYI